jgi:DNA repair protein RadD
LLNKNLAASEIYNELKEFIEPAQLLVNNYDVEKIGPNAITGTPLRNKAEFLGIIHHALNIHRYQEPKFREKLIQTADELQLLEFFKEIDLISKDKKKLTSIEIMDFSKEASRLSWKDDEPTRAFVKIFGYDESLVPIKEDIKTVSEIILTPKKDHKTGKIILVLNDDKPLKELYLYQSKIFFEADELVENKYMKFMLTMPTGSGKTRTAMEIVTHYFNRDDNRQVLWLAGQKELNEQAIESFKHVWPHLGKSDKKIYRLWDRYESDQIENNSLIIAGVKKLSNLLEKNSELIKPKLIIIDEAHHAIAPQWKALIEKLVINSKACVIGLTATPIRGNSNENEKLKNFFQNRIIEIESDGKETNPIAYLQKKGFLARVIEKPKIESKTKFNIPRDVLRKLSRREDFPDEFLSILAKNHERNYSIVKKLIELSGKKTLYFGTNRFQTKLMCTILIAKKIKAAYVDGSSPTAYRNNVIKKFKEGDIDIICNCELFTTGFDEPKIEAIVIGRPTQSKVIHQQMVGRGMRGPKMGGTPNFELYEMDDKLEELGIEGIQNFIVNEWE